MNQCKRGNIINIRQTVVALCFIILLIATVSFASASDMSDNMTVSEVDDQDTIKATEIQKDALGEGQKSFEQLDEEIHDGSVPEGGLIALNSSYTFSGTDNVSVGTDGIDITKDVTIDGKGYALDASNKASIFKIANNAHVVLKNIVFSNGNATDGGAIYVEAGSTIEVINCTFQNNFASNDGGAIYMADDSLTSVSSIKDSIFTQNIAANNGGAIYTLSTLNVTQSDFSYNNASNSGGSMYVGGAVHISQSTFDHESAASGGAIDLYDEEDNHSTIENSSFTNCYSTGDGGAVYIRTDNVIVENVEFTTTLQVMTVVPYSGKVATEGYIILHVPTTGVSAGTRMAMTPPALGEEQSVLQDQMSQYPNPASLQVQPTLMKARIHPKSMVELCSSQVMM